jgi:hypothetical protein
MLSAAFGCHGTLAAGSSFSYRSACCVHIASTYIYLYLITNSSSTQVLSISAIDWHQLAFTGGGILHIFFCCFGLLSISIASR